MPDKHYVTVRAAVVKDGKLFLQKEFRKKAGDYVYDLPGGRIDIGENLHEGLRREIQEEVGVEIKNISNLPIKTYSFQGGNDGVVDLIYSTEFVSEDFKFDTTEEQEVSDALFMSKEEFEKTQTFSRFPFILELFDDLSLS
jgi:ADP-ribose pyrophosphatase YjhB (NUDIX family)